MELRYTHDAYLELPQVGRRVARENPSARSSP